MTTPPSAPPAAQPLDLMQELRDRLPECPRCCERSTFPAGELCGKCRGPAAQDTADAVGEALKALADLPEHGWLDVRHARAIAEELARLRSAATAKKKDEAGS